MRRLRMLLVLLLPVAALSGQTREAPVSLPTLSLPTISAQKTVPTMGAVLPEIPSLPGTAVPQIQSLAPVSAAQTGAKLTAQIALGANALPNGPQDRSLPLTAALPAEQIAAQAAIPDGDPQAQSAAAFDGWIKRGFELEYAVEGGPQSASELLPGETYGAALESAAKHFPLGKAAISEDEKHKLGHKKASAEDDAGRTWKAIPEEVNGVKFDGVELITPPLGGRSEVEKLELVHEEALAGGLLVRGMSSSMHVTYDVSHLVKEDGDANDLVDVILRIENNWEKIYGAASPTRYGTIVNRFSTPLSVDHPELFEQLAAMPRSERSFENVRALFARFEDAESKRWGGHPGKNWKMRAANYGKLFGLQATYEAQPLRVIEFRIADLPSKTGEIAAISELFAALVAKPLAQDGFAAPFKGAASLREYNAAIRKQDPAAYAAFVESLGLSPSAYPLMGKLEGAHPLAAAAKAALGIELDLSRGDEKALSAAYMTGLPGRRFAAAAMQGLTAEGLRGFGEKMMFDPDPAVREAAFEQLIELGGEALWPVLYHAVKDAGLQYWVVTALVHRDDPRAAPLIRQLLASEDFSTRTWAWHALSVHTTVETVQILQELMKPDMLEEARKTAESILDRRSDAAALKVRLKIMQDAIEAEKLTKLKAKLLTDFRALPAWKQAWLKAVGKAPEGA